MALGDLSTEPEFLPDGVELARELDDALGIDGQNRGDLLLDRVTGHPWRGLIDGHAFAAVVVEPVEIPVLPFGVEDVLVVVFVEDGVVLVGGFREVDDVVRGDVATELGLGVLLAGGDDAAVGGGDEPLELVASGVVVGRGHGQSSLLGVALPRSMTSISASTK